MIGRLLRIAALCAFLGPSFALAGYGWGGYCWDELEVAMGVHTAWYNTAATGAKILMFNPTAQRVYYLQGNDVLFVDSVYVCNSPGMGDLGTAHMSWYSPSSGVKIAGSGSGNVDIPTTPSVLTANVSGWTMTSQDGLKLGIAIAGLFTVAAVFRVLAGVGSSRSSDDD